MAEYYASMGFLYVRGKYEALTYSWRGTTNTRRRRVITISCYNNVVGMPRKVAIRRRHLLRCTSRRGRDSDWAMRNESVITTVTRGCYYAHVVLRAGRAGTASGRKAARGGPSGKPTTLAASGA